MSRGVELPYTVFGRHIRPFSFVLMCATVIISVQFFTMAGAPGDGFVSQHIMGTVGLVGAVCLFIGWAFENDWWHDYGLLFVTAVWAGRAALYAMQGGWDEVGLYLSVCWALGALGAWVLERYDHKWQHVVAERRSGVERREHG